MAEKLKSLRNHGCSGKYLHDWIGVNSRLDALQAAVLRVKLKRLDAWSEGRRRNAARYTELLKDGPVETPRAARYQTRHIYNQFVIRTQQRDELRERLNHAGVPTEIYYPSPLHLQPAFAYLGYQRGDFPEAERASQEVLSLPIFAELTEDQQRIVLTNILKFYHQ